MAARLIGPLRLLLVGLAGAGALLLPVASAQGAYVPKGSFGSPGAGDAQLNLVAPNLPAPPRTAGSGVAVNETTHNIYVGDTGNHRVLQFSSTGSFIRAFGADVGGPGIDVCTVGCVAGTSESSPGAFETPTFVAVDNSAGPSGGDVYVVDSRTTVTDDVVSKFEADGTLIASWGSGGQLDGSTATEGPFGEIGGIAVDSAGSLDVFRFEPPRIFQFDEDGTFSATLEVLSGSSPGGLGVDPSDNFFKTNGTPRVQKLDPSGADTVPPYGRVSASESSAGLAVYRSTGELFVVRKNGSIDRYEFEPSGEVSGTGGCTPAPAPFEGCPPTETISEGVLGTGGGLATDSTLKTVYAADPGVDSVFAFTSVTSPTPITEAPSGLGPEEATLNGSVNPNGVPLTACFFEYDTTEYKEDDEPHGEIAPCEDPDATEVGAGTSPVPVHADISDLDPGTVYHYRLVAANTSDQAEGEDEEFASLGPIISPASVSQITGTGTRASGTINPNGEASSFVVEYVTEAQFNESLYAEAQSAPAVPRELGSGTEAVEVFQQLSGLVPNTTYHLRLAASNGSASVVGEDRTFTTFAAPTVLPDGRAYELVSPPQKTGEVFAPEPLGRLGGSCIECLPGFNNTMMPMQAAPDGEAVLYVGQPFAAGLASGPNQYLAKRSASGWTTQSRSGPLFGTNFGQGYTATSADLSRSVYYQNEAALSPEAPSLGGDAYANLYLREEGGQMRPLVTKEPPNRNPENVGDGFRIFYAGANAGTALAPPLGHVIFEANDALTVAAPEVEAAEDCSFAGTECNLYEWFEGELRLINVLPDNIATSTSGVIGSGRLLLNSSAVAPNVEQAISDDGRRIFWSEEGSGQVFVRVDGTETLEVPGPGKCKESFALAQRVCFLTASADGTSVLLSDGQLYELNGTETAYEEGPDLAGGLGGFEGILGASEDLSRIYFVDTAVLSGGEENENEEEAEAGKFNLYAWSGGMPEFIGKLVAKDNSLGSLERYGAWRSSRPHRTAQVSPDGRFLAFMSRAQLTGYDNSGGCGSEPCFEVFEYAADEGSLSCASCNPNGQLPVGRSNLILIVSKTPRFPPFRQPGNLSEAGEGRLFFESEDALASRDTNGKVVDVYQWVPEGLGGCKEAGGCVSLISSGHSGNDSMFLDSSPSGKDAFFVTREKLLPPDQNSQLDLYVARAPHTPGEVVGFPEGGTAAPCVGEACKGGASTPPPGQDIGSAAFTGPGNLTRPRPSRCARGKVRRRGRCVAKRKAKQQRKRTRQTNHRRSAR
jgi:hypothetical protein